MRLDEYLEACKPRDRRHRSSDDSASSNRSLKSSQSSGSRGWIRTAWQTRSPLPGNLKCDQKENGTPADALVGAPHGDVSAAAEEATRQEAVETKHPKKCILKNNKQVSLESSRVVPPSADNDKAAKKAFLKTIMSTKMRKEILRSGRQKTTASVYRSPKQTRSPNPRSRSMNGGFKRLRSMLSRSNRTLPSEKESLHHDLLDISNGENITTGSTAEERDQESFPENYELPCDDQSSVNEERCGIKQGELHLHQLEQERLELVRQRDQANQQIREIERAILESQQQKPAPVDSSDIVGKETPLEIEDDSSQMSAWSATTVTSTGSSKYSCSVENLRSPRADHLRKSQESSKSPQRATLTRSASVPTTFASTSTVKDLDWTINGLRGKYTGTISKGMPHGLGALRFYTGAMYRGPFHLGQMHGTKAKYQSVYSTYEGSFVYNMKHGHGEEWFVCGQRYIGGYRNNRPHGFGTKETATGTIAGEWFNGELISETSDTKPDKQPPLANDGANHARLTSSSSSSSSDDDSSTSSSNSNSSSSSTSDEASASSRDSSSSSDSISDYAISSIYSCLSIQSSSTPQSVHSATTLPPDRFAMPTIFRPGDDDMHIPMATDAVKGTKK